LRVKTENSIFRAKQLRRKVEKCIDVAGEYVEK